MHFDCRLAGLGARFVLDRDGAGADGNSLRVYDEFFGSVIGYSGYGGDYSVIDADSDEDDGSSDDGNDTDDINNSNNDPNFFFRKYTRRSPTRTRERVVGAAKSFLARLFSSGKSDDKDKAPLDSTTTSTTTTTTCVTGTTPSTFTAAPEIRSRSILTWITVMVIHTMCACCA